MFQVVNVNVEHRLMVENVISANQVHGTIQIVKDACATDIQTHAILVLECVLIAKGLLKEIIAIGMYNMKFISQPFNCFSYRCIEGYYGDPRLGIDIPCRPCPCPGTSESGHSFASRCALDPKTKDVYCECQEGYKGNIALDTRTCNKYVIVSCGFFL